MRSNVILKTEVPIIIIEILVEYTLDIADKAIVCIIVLVLH